MNKASQLVEKRDQILEAASKAGIRSILFYSPSHREIQEEDDFVSCFVSFHLASDESKKDTPNYYKYNSSLLKNFKEAVEKLVGFEMLITILETKKLHLEDFASSTEKEWQEVYQMEKNIINAAIPLEELTAGPSLLEQVNDSLTRVENSPLALKEPLVAASVENPAEAKTESPERQQTGHLKLPLHTIFNESSKNTVHSNGLDQCITKIEENDAHRTKRRCQ